MTVFLHIGHHKTGTSSIQATMYENAAFLRRHAIAYPTFARNHWPFAIPFLSDEDVAPYRDARTDPAMTREAGRAIADFVREAKGCPTHIISAESFFDLRPETLGRLRRFFHDNGHDTRIIAYVRDPVALVSSLHSQAIFMGVADLSGFPYRENFVRGTIEAYVAAFGRDAVTVRPFGARHFVGGDLLTDFLSAVTPEAIVLPTTAFRNKALTLPGLRVMHALNRIGVRGGAGRGEDGYVRKIAGPEFRTTRRLAADFIRAQEGSRAYLAAEFGIRFDDVDLSGFPETLSADFPDETLESVIAVLARQQGQIARLAAQAAHLGGKGRRGAGARIGRSLRDLFGGR